MFINLQRFAWLKSGLFWRTFFLLGFLITASMAAWIASYRMVEGPPRAKQIAAQIISVVTITRAALTHSAPDLRRELLFDLASDEGIRIYPLESTDRITPAPESNLMPVIEATVKSKLGADTRFAGMVNDVEGFWVSFKIDEDAYWLMLDRNRIDRTSNVQWLGWASTSLLLSLVGAVFISRLINQPLTRLAEAARAVTEGLELEPLPESGITEIRAANRSFNHMVDDLNQIDTDRAVILAGISHDLRTPISRMLLEVEMADLPDDARQGMQSDLAQMDAIIGQFLDYARPTDTTQFLPIDLTTLLKETVHEAQRLPDVQISSNIDNDAFIMGNAIDIKRVINNIIENARRYGKIPDAEMVEIDLSCHVYGGTVTLQVADHGPGVPDSDMERLLRPFARLDASRSQANGAGLGLAIVQRVVNRHNGELSLHNGKEGGLVIQITFDTA